MGSTVEDFVNPDQAKQAQVVIFSGKTNKIVHTSLYFSNATVKTLVKAMKYLSLKLDNKPHSANTLTIKLDGLDGKIRWKIRWLLRKLQPKLPCRSLLIINKSFIRPNFDYGDVIYDQPYNA